MQFIRSTSEPLKTKATLDSDHALDGAWVRQAIWEEGDVTVKCLLVTWVVGIRCRKHPDGSWTMLGVMSRFDVLGKDEFVQPVERGVFLWERHVGNELERTATDYLDDVGIWYQPTVEQAMQVCRDFVKDFDFEEKCDPEAWEDVPVNG